MLDNLPIYVFFRLWKKIKGEKKIVYPVQQRLDEISNLFDGAEFVKVDNLADSEVNLLLFLVEYFLFIET